MELYGVDLPVLVNGLYPMAIRVPGWVNFGILRAKAMSLPTKKRRTR